MRYIISLAILCTSMQMVFAYEADRLDYVILDEIQERVIDAHYPDRTKDQITTYKTKITKKIDTLDDPRMIWFMGQVLRLIQDKQKPSDPVIKTVEVSPNDAGTLRVRLGSSYDDDIIGKLYVGDTEDIYQEKDGFFRIRYDEQYAWIAVEYTHLAGTEAPTHHLTTPTLAIPDSGVSASKKEFLDTYWPLVESKDKEILGLCTKYFDQVDEVAREHDFPVELIIATWYREHTCKFYNPGNGRGNFQITSNYYPPGEITRAEFRSQIVDFIKFSWGKRDYYDLTQNYGPDPISLSYDTIDLASIRKHAIYYNGISGELATNKYTNTNFNGVGVGGTDGIVTYFLKALKWNLEER